MPTRDTRTRLILAGEVLFATSGVEAVSLRAVNQAAGQRNKSAIHYHFGRKEALVEAIFEHRMPPIDRRRQALLDALEAHGRTPGLRDIVSALVRPLAEHVECEEPEGELMTVDGPIPLRSHYVRFSDQLMRQPGRWLIPAVRGRWDTGIERACRGIEAHLDTLSPSIRRHRISSVLRDMVHALADREARFDAIPTLRAPDLPLPLFVADLIDCLVGQLRARISAETLAELARFESRCA